ncbi:tagaturonate epimerase [Fodinibius roseus]|uniref:Tagaturonate/fructuronate epimerase n=1 Tax=Fodinibius roseus TaxID=1194090 RepID=A0A1M5G5T9_9BACT|nr:tagaturonate epimerase family protein [Fodinibius roseus]SHF98821.1 tagaturonate epimerase [Fodinibius roseus]
MLGRYSLGTGDRFGQQGEAQLKAIKKAKADSGVQITPVWNKSHREHEIIGTTPPDVREEADNAVARLSWDGPYCVDADHITREIVDPYIACSDFFTIDVADYIGEKCDPDDNETFIRRNADLIGTIAIPGIDKEFKVTDQYLSDWADQYLRAINQAGEIFEYIRDRKEGQAVYEISMDEVETPQTPLELYFILKTAAEKGITIHTVAPKFTGDFYKGVDYVGELDQFIKEFEQDLLVIAHAVDTFNLPESLKLSIHSGSDKFSLYPHIRRLLDKHEAGVHLKTSGTTWLEELIGLAEAGPQGLSMVKEIYEEAYGRYDELTGPYAPVISIDQSQLPAPDRFSGWSGQTIASKLEHNPEDPAFDSQLRQFLHCSYKIAAEEGDEFIRLLRENREEVGRRVTQNLYTRHIEPLFLGN